MFLLLIGVTVFSLLCTLSIDFYHLFFMIKLLLNCFMAKFLITAHLESLAVCAMLLHWLIIDLNLILELSNVFSWAISLLLKVTNCLIYILKEFLYRGMLFFMSPFSLSNLFLLPLFNLPLTHCLNFVFLMLHPYLLMIYILNLFLLLWSSI